MDNIHPWFYGALVKNTTIRIHGSMEPWSRTPAVQRHGSIVPWSEKKIWLPLFTFAYTMVYNNSKYPNTTIVYSYGNNEIYPYGSDDCSHSNRMHRMQKQSGHGFSTNRTDRVRNSHRYDYAASSKADSSGDCRYMQSQDILSELFAYRSGMR